MFGNDSQYQELKKKAAELAASSSVSSSVSRATEASSASPSFASPPLRAAVQPSINQLTPLKHRGGSAQERVIMGKSGMWKLSLKYDAETNAISLLDEPVWDI